ncbi:MAG: hypothetical protein AAB914_02485 [Patescibacteria group bacterium]
MRSKISPPINPNPEIERILSSAYETAFVDFVVGNQEIAGHAVECFMILGSLDYSISDRVDPRADFIGRANMSWPALVKERLDNHTKGLDIAPARLRALGEDFLKLDPGIVKAMPVLIIGRNDFNRTPNDMSDVDYVKMVLDRNIHPMLPQAIGQRATKVA